MFTIVMGYAGPSEAKPFPNGLILFDSPKQRVENVELLTILPLANFLILGAAALSRKTQRNGPVKLAFTHFTSLRYCTVYPF